MTNSRKGPQDAAPSPSDTSRGVKWKALPWYSWSEGGVCVSFDAMDRHPQWYCENSEFTYLLFVENPFIHVQGLPKENRFWIREEWVYKGRGAISWQELQIMAESLLARGRGKSKPAGKKGDSLPKPFCKEFPILAAFLSDAKDETGAEREFSKISVFVDQDALKGSLSDPSNECTLFVTLEAPGAVFEALEARLGSGEADWRSWGGGRVKKSRAKGGR